MSVFQSIIRTGLSASDTDQEKRGIVLSNCMALILLGALIAINISRLFFSGAVLTTYTLIGFILFISPVILNRLSLTRSGRLIVCVAPVFFIWYVFVSQMMAMEIIGPSIYSGFRIFLVAVCFVPYLLFSKEELLLLILGTLPTLLSVIFFNNILTLLDLGPEKFGLTSPDYDLQPARTVIAYAVISAGCYAFHFIINRIDELNKKLIIEIKSQNEKLVQSELNLSNLNHSLEELVEKKVESIKKQNELLMKYAHANAHHVRGPLARILGLIQLKKIDPSLTFPWFFEKVENETNQIDVILKRISVDFNEAMMEHEK